MLRLSIYSFIQILKKELQIKKNKNLINIVFLNFKNNLTI